MAKVILSTAVFMFVLVGSVHMQQNNLGNLPNQLPNMQLPLDAQNLLSNAQGSGLLDTIRGIPSRGIQMLSNTLSNVRNMLGGLGRNGSNGFTNGMSNPMSNMLPQNLMNNGLPNGQQLQQQAAGLTLPSLPGLNFLTDPLQQALNGLPTNGLTNGLTSQLNGLTGGLTNGLGQLGNALPRMPTN